MKLINVCFFCFSTFVFSQYTSQNISNSQEPHLNVLIELVNKIENGNADYILEYIDMRIPPDFEHIKTETNRISKRFKSKSLKIYETNLIIDKNQNYWILRNYYQSKKNKQKLVYQIYLEVAKQAEDYSIINIDFREGKRLSYFD